MDLSQATVKSYLSTATDVEWEEIGCPLCDGEDAEVILEARDPLFGDDGLWFAVARCRECQLSFTNPRPTQETIDPFYPLTYQPHQSITTKNRRHWRRRHSRLPRKLMRRHALKKLPKRGRLLDFGCGGGVFLEKMRQLGWQVTGIDSSAIVVERLQDELDLDVLAGSLPHPELVPESFDVITMWHSLEHVHAPRGVLEAAWDLLVPGGKLVVAVPNIDSLPFRWFNSCWYGLDLPRHLTHFNSITLSKMLMSCGFDIESLQQGRHSSWLRYSARMACGRGRPTIFQRMLQSKGFSRLASWYMWLTNQSDALLVVSVKPS